MGAVCCAADGDDPWDADRRSVAEESVVGCPAVLTDERPSQPVVLKLRGRRRESTRVTKAEHFGTEFKMVIDKTTGRRLGVRIDYQGGSSLQVDAVTDGLFQQWNDDHPELAVKPGDRIVEVNGVCNDVLLLVEEFGRNKMLEVVVERGP
jgi:hypothetical protein